MIPNIYEGNYKLLIIPPILLIIAAIIFIPQIKLGVDFQGGTLITLSLKNSIDAEQLQADLLEEGIEADVTSIQTAVGIQAEIELPQSETLILADNSKNEFLLLAKKASLLEIASTENQTALDGYIEKKKELSEIGNTLMGLAGFEKNASAYPNIDQLQKRVNEAYTKVYSNYQQDISEKIKKYLEYDSISVKTISPTLSASFLEKALQIIGAATFLSVIFVFIFIREVIPSIAVLTGAFADMIIAVGAMGYFGIPISIPSLAAILMLIGFSLDTDILLTIRMLKRGGNPRINAFESMKTGMTMTLSLLIAFGTLFILATLTNIATFHDISAIAIAGLFGDLFAVWGINAVIMIWYVENKKVN